MKLCIKGGTVVNATGSCRCNVLTDGPRIVYVGADTPPADLTLAAEGCYAMPGFIDPHTHLELSPGLFGRDTEAAALGGTTGVLEFANQTRGQTMEHARGLWGDCAALWQALHDGEIDTVGTDHCSFSGAQKREHRTDFRLIPNGCAGLQHRAQLLYTYDVRAGRISLERMAACLSANPALLFGLTDRGVIAPDKQADLVIWDPETVGRITDDNQHHDCDQSIYDGFEVPGRAREVLINGELVVQDGALTRSGGGRYVHCDLPVRYRR